MPCTCIWFHSEDLPDESNRLILVEDTVAGPFLIQKLKTIYQNARSIMIVFFLKLSYSKRAVDQFYSPAGYVFKIKARIFHKIP